MNPMMAVAVRDEYTVQTVPRVYSRDGDYPSSDEEQVYDHRPPRPVSRRGGGQFAPSQSQQQQQRANGSAEQGFLMAAAMVALSLVVCCGETDE